MIKPSHPARNTANLTANQRGLIRLAETTAGVRIAKATANIQQKSEKRKDWGLMIKECPFCRSIRIVETLKGSTSICLACESIWGDKSKPTLFDRITNSVDTLAVEFVGMMYDRVFGEDKYYSMLTGEFYNNREEAHAATVTKLKEVAE